MIFKNTYFFILLFLLSSFTFNDENTEAKREKKLEKAIKGIWDSNARLVPFPVSINDHGFNKFEAVLLKNDTIGIVYSGRVFSCRSGGCSIDPSSNHEGKGNSEYFDVFMVFDTQFAIKKVDVYNYQATHGQEVSARSWLKQFINYKGENLRYGKDIDALSGATISAENLTNEVVRISHFLNKQAVL